MKIFVYGTLQRNRSNSHFLKNATYLGEAVTDKYFDMIDVGFPMIRPSDKPKARPVKGELYDIGDDTETLAALDRLEGVGRGFYDRVTGYVMCKGMRRRASYYVSAGEFHAPTLKPNKDGYLEWRKRA